MTAERTIFIFPTADGKLDAGETQSVAGFTASLRKPGAKLLLHLHGGLVNERHGRETANRLMGPPPNGWGLPNDWTQAYVVWRTGVWETLQNNWTDLAHNDRLYQIVLRKLMEFVAGKLGIPGAAGRSAAAAASLTPAEIARRLRGEGDRRAPFADVDLQAGLATPQGRGPVMAAQDDASLGLEFQDFIAQDTEFNGAVADIDAVVNEAAPGRAALSAGDKARGEASYRRLDPKVRAPIERLRPDPAGGRVGAVGVGIFLVKHAGKIAMRSFKRFRTRRDHGFHATLVEEVAREMYGDFVGATVWNMMVKDAADHFTPDGFGLDLLKAIPDDNPVHVVVTAHSAGSIWAARMLEAVKATGKPITLNLFLLAPAARTDLFAEALDAAGDRVARCRMFTMSDAYERKDAVLGHDKGYIYPSSLLYLVSGLFEEAGGEAFPDAPILGMQRFMGATWLDDTKESAAGQRIAAFFQAPDHAISYSPAPDVTTADTHSGFSSEPLTLASVRQLM